ncbi:hypothetical protein [Propionivibrio sp.]|uniref:hypothetical protein n=1 Tax=Propionivibrio sp. TaxID=2212460 RepID=UPI003BF34821
MPAPRHLNLQAIDRSLSEVQGLFTVLSERFFEPRDPLMDSVRNNLLVGYALIDDYVARGIDLFSLQNVGLLLEINATVLCGTDPAKRAEYDKHIAATEKRFFSNEEGSIKDLLEWYGAHRNDSIWKRAAGVYIRILSKPQLFIEGNHRSGSLIVSYLLMRDGFPPFVLTLDNAASYFNPSTVIRNLPKRGFKMLFKIPGIKKKFARFLEAQAKCLSGMLLADQAPQSGVGARRAVPLREPL